MPPTTVKGPPTGSGSSAAASGSQGPKDLWLAQPLVEGGAVTAAQAQELATSERGSVWKAAVARGHTSTRQILEVISIRFKVPIADLSGIDARAAALLPEAIARKYQVVAIGADDRLIRIATADPRDLALEQTLAFVTGRGVMFLAAGPDEIAEKIDQVYRPEEAVNGLVDGLDLSPVETLDGPPPAEPARDPTLEAPMARLVDVDIRVSTVPVARRGEKVVIRILDKLGVNESVAALSLPASDEEQLLRLLDRREGIILVTGPAGSGKTTTLYAAINQLKTGQANIVTVEDPVEYDMPGISQLQVSESQGFTFANALRSVLRQDPDIVLVGEIRDAETATVATQASLSGHLVLATLDTNDAPSAVVRLRDLGVESHKIGAALKGVIAQRLIRRVCPACAAPLAWSDLPPDARPGADRAPAAAPRKAVGCKQCGGTGYRGRLAIVEIMPVDDRVAELIGAGALPNALLSAARPAGMRTLWESGLERVWQGLTTLDEVVRVVGERVTDVGADVAPGPTGAPSRALAPLAAAIAPVSPRDDSGTTRILITDADRQMRRLVRMILERDGHEVLEAADGLAALDVVESGRVDLMVLDLGLPRLDGLGVLEELRARVMTASLPVIVLTARSGATESRALDLGAQDFITKPVQPASLQARVRAVLRRTRMQ